MKPTVVLLAGLLLCTSSLFAGEVYGTIAEGAKPLPAGIKVEISASGKVYNAETDKFGSYRIVVNEKGKCTLTLRLRDQAPSVELYSYDKATRYDWIVETKDGKISLRRK